MLAEGLGNVSNEKVASGILQNKTKRDNIKPEDKFPLETIFLVVVCTPDNKCNREFLKKITFKSFNGNLKYSKSE